MRNPFSSKEVHGLQLFWPNLHGKRFLLVACMLSSLLHANAGTDFNSPFLVTQVPQAANTPPVGWNSSGLVRSDWFDGARIAMVTAARQVQNLTEGFVSACDPCLSFDAKRVIFSGKKDKQANWRIWEMDIDGANLHAISPENQDARNPVYAATLFTLDSPEPWFTIVYAGRESRLNDAGNATGSSLYNIKLDGSEQRRLTYNPNCDMDPFQMWDGRVLYAAEHYPSEPGASSGRVGLHSISIAGTEMVVFGAENGRRIQHMPCATEDRLVVFVESDQLACDGAGQLACVQERRPNHSYKALTSDPAWQYLYPSPWKTNLLLVSRRPADFKTPSEACCFDMGTGECSVLLKDPAWSLVQAQAVQSRPLPDGHSTVVEPAKFKTGVFYALNCYDTDDKMAPHVSKGMFKRLRVIEGMTQNLVSTQASNHTTQWNLKRPFVARRLLGEAPIEADGSFNIEVPADTPIYLQPLDERGLAIGTCGWVWVKPRETRGCIGCHEDAELTPENVYVAALRRSSTFVAPPVSQRKVLGFKETVAPIIKNRCASTACHGMTDSPLYLPLMADMPSQQDMEQTYLALRSSVEGGPGSPSSVPKKGKYIDAGRARTSPLVWRLVGMDTSRPWDRASGSSDASPRKYRIMPPQDKGGPLSEDEIRTIMLWIDAGAAWESIRDNKNEPSAAKPAESHR